MTDDEFDVLDELYFVQSFQELIGLTGMESLKLRSILSVLYEKGWIRIFNGIDNEVPKEQVDLTLKAEDYIFLASKEGLMAHNTTD